ncbi:hypothetical protein JW707_04020 [Candidatus Woesearchaeota archaeon]|nr:hypothetical protein [Candidatus Woesearchaeota archaeon]
MEEEEMTTEDIANCADAKADALVDLLIKKGLITEKEFEDEYNSMFEEEPSEEGQGSDEDDEEKEEE